MAASGFSNPQDVIKVRQQLHGTSNHAFWAVGAQMIRNEGVRSLLNGFTASMLRETVYSGLRLGGYELFKDKLYTAMDGKLSREGITLKVLAASAAASIGAALANPADLVKVRMQAHYPNGSPYESTRHAFVSVFREGASSHRIPLIGGLHKLYGGVAPTIVRGVVLSASQICSYDQVKQTLKKRGIMQEGLGLHFTASLFAGLFCSITSNPVDVVKVRLMSDKTGQYKGVVDCIRMIMVNEGPRAFYKGFGMCWGRLGAHTIVSFLVFERLRSLCGMAPM
ncbi:mitochondrial carrier [Cytidiella melzeri]|nr:mitochondrial carrier [Cytidiella melzeri]